MRDVALKTEPSFTVNVTLDEQKRITGVFAGELVAAHEAAIAQAARQAVRPIPHLFDVVVATNMGYPADLVLYQSVKGMSVAAQACAPGGTILLVAECREGLGGDEYVELMRSEASPAALLRAHRAARGHETVLDQWQVQVQAMVQARCDVWLHSSLPRETVEALHLRYAPDVTRHAGADHRREARGARARADGVRAAVRPAHGADGGAMIIARLALIGVLHCGCPLRGLRRRLEAVRHSDERPGDTHRRCRRRRRRPSPAQRPPLGRSPSSRRPRAALHRHAGRRAA